MLTVGVVFRGSASVMVESTKHNQQYPNMYPFLQQSDVYSETFRKQYVSSLFEMCFCDPRVGIPIYAGRGIKERYIRPFYPCFVYSMAE